MRCIVVADLHYSLPQFDWLLAAAHEFDLVIFAGDALNISSSVDVRAQIVVVKKYLTLLSGITRVICAQAITISMSAVQRARRCPAGLAKSAI